MTETASSPRLHVICAHEPDADPRIGWTADTAAHNHFEVSVVGWIADRPAGEVRAASYLVKRLGQIDAAKPATWLAIQMLSRLNPILLPLAVLAAVVMAPLWLVITLLLLPWRMLDYVAERLGQHERTTRRIERLVLSVRAWFFWRVDDLADGGLVRLINGLNAYRWYFFTHAGAFARRYIQWLENHPESRPDVIHANDPDALLAAVLAKSAFGCRVIYDAHEYGPDAYILHTRPRALFFAYERLLMRHVDGAVTVSPPIAEKFNKTYNGKPHFVVVPNASPLADGLKPDPQFSLDELAHGRIRVLYQGGFAAGRGLEQVIDGWAKVDDTKAALFLRGPNNAHRDALIRAAARTGRLDQSIYFLPSVSEDKLTIAAMDADIGLVPYLSHIENHQGACPNKVGQYMQAGIAIVSANLPYVAALLSAGECGEIYDDLDENALHESLMKLIQQPDILMRMGQNGRAFARKHYNFESYFPILASLYRGSGTGIQNSPNV